MAAFRVTLALILAAPQASASRGASAKRIAIISPNAGADSPLKEDDAESFVSLLQSDVLHERKSELRPPYDPGWFGGFAEGESTFDQDGKLAHRSTNPAVNVMDGWNPQQKNPFFDKAVDSKMFQETASGGDQQAWQTFYPAEQASMSGNRAQTGAWFEGKGGVWQQEYLSSAKGPANSASWFDDSVNQLDGFGRQKLPSVGSLRNYLEWEERSVNTSLACQAAGCTANVSLLAPFDFNKEMYKNCRLSVFFHPTDFDDQYGGESVEWVQVNGRKVKTQCRPMAMGCNNTASRPLLPCVDDVPIDLLLDDTARNGDLKVSAKIHDSVDECAYNGNLLSAVPVVTCLVSPKQGPPAPVTLLDNAICETKMPLQCATKGCAAEIAIPVNASCAGLGPCLLSVQVQQTDYDNADGTSELIEYIKVDGKSAASKVNPGKNPCKTKWSGGVALTESEMSFAALTDHAVNVTNGKVVVEGKITKYVDECASNGYLFDAIATVKCSKPVAALLQKEKSTPPRRKLKLKM